MTATLIGRLLAPLVPGRIGLLERLRRAEALHRQRTALRAEACRPIWDAPAHWYDARPRKRHVGC
ncbi:MAG: hypothetical protein CVT80_07975 [Alphaproteobacteria bacterium HGW-Alphaproteobacteria-2]|nr:MAG: hypothetical protein CVT80_07975 [Alphaproteobacteria bacterium HGW-Alphaproteobacteria-2]